MGLAMMGKQLSVLRSPAKNAMSNPEHQLIKKRKPHYFLAVLIFFFLSTTLIEGAFCKSRSVNNNPSVSIAPLKDQEKKKYGLKMIQPYAFNLKTIQKVMQSLAYQERNVSWSSKKRVFSSEDIHTLAPKIKKQFTLASKNHRVIFQIKNPNGRTLLKGDTFLTKLGMHWRITMIKRSTRKIGDFSVMGDSWRLVPLTGQVYKTHERHKNLIQDITNWVLFNKFHPNPKRVLKEPALPQHQDAPRSPAKVKERLKVLDELKREELINEKEYEEKRREILNRL